MMLVVGGQEEGVWCGAKIIWTRDGPVIEVIERDSPLGWLLRTKGCGGCQGVAERILEWLGGGGSLRWNHLVELRMI